MRRIFLIALAGMVVGLSITTVRTVGNSAGELPAWWQLVTGPVSLMRDESGSVGEAKEALARDSATPYKWCTLAEQMEDAGDWDGAKATIKRAVELGSSLPQVRMRAANLYFRNGDAEEALRHAVRVLEITPAYDAVLFGFFRRLEIPVEEVLAAGIAEEARVGRAYLQNAQGWASPSEVRLIWEDIRERGHVDGEVVNQQIAYLISHRLYTEAAAAWGGYVEAGESPYGELEFLYNGGFEREFSGSVMDWRLSGRSGAAVDRERTKASDGEHGLGIKFDQKRNVTFRDVTQLTYLPPGEYRLTAKVRTDGLSTDRGVYLRVFDRDDPRKLNAKTDEVRETDGWELLEASFRVGDGGSMAGVQICRDESLRIDSKITGEVWFDEISLRPAGR